MSLVTRCDLLNKFFFFLFLNYYLKLQSSDEDLPAKEEEEVLRLRKENAKSLSLEDFGLEDISQDESDEEPTLEVGFHIIFLFISECW